jgi:hypothetical protein
MAVREEYVKSLMDPIYTVQEQRWNTQNYPYWKTLSRWETHTQALENIPKYGVYHPPKVRIVRTRLQATQTGRIAFTEDFVVLDEKGVWHPHYDPRTNDPEWKTYVRLKEKFDE